MVPTPTPTPAPAPTSTPVRYYTVTFDANGHGTAPKPQIVEEGRTATKPSDPAADGYTFGGWYTDSKCTEAYDFSTPVTADITLYAKWTGKRHGFFWPWIWPKDDDPGDPDSSEQSSQIPVVGLQSQQGAETGSKTPVTGDASGSKTRGNSPDTGDESHALLWLLSTLASLAVLAAAVFYPGRARRRGRERK
jgi:uncharacterized repeat protein (TIGR02543 family)